jgi:hypothetical protein
MPIHVSGLHDLTAEQQELLKAYALYCHLLATDPEDLEARARCLSAEERLIAMKISPCYDPEDDCYTFVSL